MTNILEGISFAGLDASGDPIIDVIFSYPDEGGTQFKAKPRQIESITRHYHFSPDNLDAYQADALLSAGVYGRLFASDLLHARNKIKKMMGAVISAMALASDPMTRAVIEWNALNFDTQREADCAQYLFHQQIHAALTKFVGSEPNLADEIEFI
jgi:hypothetical protein